MTTRTEVRTCKRGHPLTEENTFRESGNGVRCRTCRRDARRAHDRRRRAERAAAPPPPPEPRWPAAPSLPPASWAAHALCAETDPEIFFPPRGVGPDAALAVCRACPVMADCRDWAIASGQSYGVWGGLTAPELRAAVKRATVTKGAAA